MRPRPQIERCELCSAPLEEVHPHLLNRHSRQIACACNACAILFCGQEGGKFLRVPRRVKQLPDFAFTDLQWEAMTLPIHLAFFLRDADRKMVALYPSPGGAIASQLDLDEWDGLLAQHPVLRSMEPEVEALLVNRLGPEAMSFLVPIDECYRLVGLIRIKWRGLSGGSEVWSAITAFFESLQRKAGGKVQSTHA